jgi:hypothetical protein
MDHPRYSPDSWLFPKVKNALKIQRFANILDIQRNFRDSFQQWHHLLTKCIASQGEHFEGDNSR